MKKNITNASYVLASSFKDFDNYPDNILSDAPEKIWRALDASSPQWIDFIFDNTMQIDQVVLNQTRTCLIKSVKIDYQEQSEPKEVKSIKINRIGDSLTINFNVISTSKLRIWIIDAGDGDAELQSVKLMGPDQIVHNENPPYWNASHIWFQEPDVCYKGSSPRFFRKTFVIDEVDEYETAFVQARTNDSYEIYINGAFACRGAKNVTAVNVKQYLHNGKNVIAAKTDLTHNPGFWGLGVFIAELSLNSESATVFYGTDKSWLSYDEELENWSSITFDDSYWNLSAEFFKPPEGIHGWIAYSPPQVKEKAILVKTTPARSFVSPGDSLHITSIIKPLRRLTGNYYFIVSIGEKETVMNWSDFIFQDHLFSPAESTCDWDADVEYSMDISCEFSYDAPSGAYKLYLKGYETETGVELDLGLSEKYGYIADVLISSESPSSSSESLDVKILFENDLGYISINGEAYPPLFWRYGSFDSVTQFQKYSSTGINLHHLCIWPRVIKTGEGYWEDDLAAIDKRLSVLFRVSPDAYAILGIALIPDLKWMKENPTELAIDAFGNTGPVSFCSLKFENEVHEYMKRLIIFIRGKSYANRIIGYNPLSCGTPDSGLGGTCNNILQQDRNKINIGDYNPQAIRAFREFLIVKYNNSLEELRTSWRNDIVTFETACPVIKHLVSEGARGSVFRDPSCGMMPFDYFEFLSHILGGFYCRLAETIKKATENRTLVFVFYGYVQAQLRAFNIPGSRLQDNDFDLSILLENENIDCFISPPSYEHRNVGQPLIPRFPVASARLHNKLYISEDDIRTFISHHKAWGRHKSEDESEAMIKYNFSDHLINGCGGWFFDQITSHEKRSGHPWFLDDKLLNYVSECQKIYSDALNENVNSSSEIVVVLSAETPLFEDVYYAPTLYKNLVYHFLYEEMRKIGAPFDIVMMSDLKTSYFHKKNYKVIIFLNAFYISAENKSNIERLKSNKRTLLFLYAPGYIDKKSGLHADGITSITGISVAESDKMRMKCVTTASTNNILKDIAEGVVYEADVFDAPESKALHPDIFGPVFHIMDDDVDVFLDYIEGTHAAGMKKFDEWTSVYTAVPFLDATIVRNIAKEAGVHIYTNANILLNANNQFICVHLGDGNHEKVKIKLPAEYRVREVFSNQSYGSSVSSFEIKMEACKTFLFKLTLVK